MAVACAGLQSVFTAAYDEAFAIPTELSARTALRVQQIVAYETDVAKTIDPLAGSYFVEALTDDMEQAITDDHGRPRGASGGMVRCLEDGYRAAAHRRARLRVPARPRLAAGCRSSASTSSRRRRKSRSRSTASTRRPSAPRPRRSQAARHARQRGGRRARSTRSKTAARGTDNLMPPIYDAVMAYATVGEITDRLRKVFGVYTPSTVF